MWPLASGIALGCGGNNDEITGLQATFTPATAKPGDLTVAVLAGTRSSDTVTVRTAATGIDDVFGATFKVAYDSTYLSFVRMDTATSLLLTGVTSADVTFIEDHATPGRVDVTATRKQNSTGTLTGVNVGPTADVVTLTFKALTTITFGDADNDGRLDGAVVFQAPNEVHSTGDVNIPVTWSSGAVTTQ